jgi:YD repeat-containing protein
VDPTGGVHALHLDYIDTYSATISLPCPIAPFTNQVGYSYQAGGDEYYHAQIDTPTALNSDVLVWDADGTVFTLYPTQYGLPNGNIEDHDGNTTVVATNNMGGVTVKDDSGRTALTLSGLGPGGILSGYPYSPTDRITAGGLPFQVNWTQTGILNYTLPGTVINAADLGTCVGFVPVSNIINTGIGIQSITLPNGQQYLFHYGGNPFGMLDEIDYPDGASVKYTWAISGQNWSQYSDQTLENSWGLTRDYFAPIPVQQMGLSLMPAIEATNGCVVRYARPMLATRTVSDGNGPVLAESYSYTTTFGPTDFASVANGVSDWKSKTTTVVSTDIVRNLTKTTVYTYKPYPVLFNSSIFQNTGGNGQTAAESTIQYYDWSQSAQGPLIRTVTKNWLSPQQVNGSPNYLGCEVDMVYTSTGGSLGSGKWYQYYPYGTPDQVSDLKEYDFGHISPASCQGANVPAAPTGFSRETVTNYQYFSAATSPQQLSVNPQYGVSYISDKPSSVIVYDGNKNRLKETDYTYDQGGLSGVSGLYANGHDQYLYPASFVAGRGNLTTVTSQCFPNCTSSTATYTYDLTGQVTSATDARGITTTYSHTDNPSGGNAAGNSNAYLTQITDALGYSESFTYNYTNGELASSTDENQQTTTYAYADPLNRLTQTTFPDGGKTTISYNDSVPSITTSTLQSPNPLKTSVAAMDGMGHVTQTQLITDPDGVDYVNTTYDGSGRVYTKTNPFRGSAPPPNTTTTYFYDALGRPIETLEQDGSTLQSCYNGVPSFLAVANCAVQLGSSMSGTWVDSTDEAGNRLQHTSDSFGRLMKVMEPIGPGATPTIPGAMPTMETDYGYDALNNLLNVTQWGGPSGSAGPRTRSFTYNSLSHLLTSTNPETGTVGYSYDANGNVLTKTDARAITTNYAYDNLNRLLAKTYTNAPSGTLSSCYAYDTAINGRTRLGMEWTTAGSCSSTSGYQTMRTFLAYDPMGRLWNEQQCVFGHCTSGPPPPCAASGNDTPYYQAYCYDLAGNMTWNVNGVSNVPGVNSISFTQAFDGAGRPSALTSSWSDTLLHPPVLFTADPTAGYTPAGALQNFILGNNISVIKGYDNRLRTTGETATQK